MSTDLPTLPDDPVTALARLLVVGGGVPLLLLLPALWIAWRRPGSTERAPRGTLVEQ